MELDIKEMRGFKVGDSFKTPIGRENWVKYYDVKENNKFCGSGCFSEIREVLGFKKIDEKLCIIVKGAANYSNKWAIPFSELERIGMIPKESEEFNIWD